MRAIVDINGKQYEVEEGRYVQIDRYNAGEDEEIVLGNVRMIVAGQQSLVGAPYISDASINVRVKRHAKGPKILVYKMRCKKGYRRKNGHRQQFTELFVDLLSFPGREKIAPLPTKAEAKPKKAETTSSETETAPTSAKAATKAPKATTVETSETEKPKKAAPKKAETAEHPETATSKPKATTEKSKATDNETAEHTEPKPKAATEKSKATQDESADSESESTKAETSKQTTDESAE